MQKIYVPPGHRLIFRAWIRDRDGNKIYPPPGKKAWALVVPIH